MINGDIPSPSRSLFPLDMLAETESPSASETNKVVSTLSATQSFWLIDKSNEFPTGAYRLSPTKDSPVEVMEFVDKVLVNPERLARPFLIFSYSSRISNSMAN